MKRSVLLFGTAVTMLASRLASAECATPTDPCVDAERFKPAVTPDGWVNAEGSGLHDTEDPWELGVFAQYARNTLVEVNSGTGVAQRFISGRLGFDLMASVTIAKPFSLGLDVPFFLAQTGDPATPSFAGLGDVRVVPKLRILDDKKVVGLALVAEVRAPTHAGDYAGGTRAPVFAPRLVLDHRFGHSGSFRLGLNAGVLLREHTYFYDVTAGSEFVYAGGIGYRFGGYAGKVEIGAEADGALGLEPVRTGWTVAEAPLEALPYVRIDPSDEWEIQAGAGIGLVAGYGIPLVRGFVGVRFHPVAHDRDHDGVPDDRDKCPDVAEDRDGVQDDDGCPEEDSDHDGVPDDEDKCPTQKETINGYKDDDGCPDEGPAQVIIEGGHISILKNVNFETGSARIDRDSYSILNQVALVLRAHPEIKRIRIEGHTDEVGTREYNMDLSRRRAAAVREYLISRHVKPDRLTSEGYGPDRPLARGRDEASRAKNRRVEFVVEQ